jgi:hypothetical protein
MRLLGADHVQHQHPAIVRPRLSAVISVLMDSESPLPRQEAERVLRRLRSSRTVTELVCRPPIVGRETARSVVDPVLRANRARRSCLWAILDGRGSDDAPLKSCPAGPGFRPWFEIIPRRCTLSSTPCWGWARSLLLFVRGASETPTADWLSL